MSLISWSFEQSLEEVREIIMKISGEESFPGNGNNHRKGSKAEGKEYSMASVEYAKKWVAGDEIGEITKGFGLSK